MTMLGRRRMVGAVAATIASPVLTMPMLSARAEAAPINLHMMRTPSYEFYARKIRNEMPGVMVSPTLMPVDQLNELLTISLSAGSDSLDLIYAGGGSTIAKYAKSGWLEPLDAYWEKYRAEYQLDGFPEDAVKFLTYDGRLYGIPTVANTELLFYRDDLLKARKVSPPRTVDDYLSLARALNSPRRSGICLRLKRVDACEHTTNWALNSMGEGWFDDRYRPLFNSDKGVAAIARLRDFAKVAAPGITTQANDECTVLMQQDQVAMQIMWVSRAAAMDSPEQSRVIGKVDFAAPPGGGAATGWDSFAISKFSRQDKDLLFRLIAGVTSEANMREGADVIIPPRTAVLQDPALVAKYRFFPALSDAVKTARLLPIFPEFPETAQIITQYVSEAVTGQMETKPAMDAAARDVEALLKERGYYKT